MGCFPPIIVALHWMCRKGTASERTCIIVKPDGIQRNLMGTITTRARFTPSRQAVTSLCFSRVLLRTLRFLQAQLSSASSGGA